MGTSAIITLRETLEASLLIVLILTILERTGSRRYVPALWAGVTVGVILSIAAGAAIHFMLRAAAETMEWLGTALMLGACALLVWLLLWMHRPGRGLQAIVAAAADTHIRNGSAIGIFFLALTTTLREGVETAVFLTTLISPLLTWSPVVGALMGILVAIGIALVLFRGARAIPLKYVFSITTVLLLLAIAHMALEVIEKV